MKKLLQLEELAITGATIYLIYLLPIQLSWWIYLLLFFAPDVSILAYSLGKRAGAVAYNLFHHKGIAATTALAGLLAGSNYIILCGLMLFAHSSFDRIMGYGLKYFTGFKHTHLGEMK